MGAFDLHRFPSPQPLAQTAANDWLLQVAALRDRRAGDPSSHSPMTNRFVSVALSGGRIARDFCAALATKIKSEGVSLQGVHFFWSDERCVLPTDPESNFRLANEALLLPLAVPAAQIHRLRGEISPDDAAASAEAELRQLTSCTSPGTPEIDLVLLGMGEDGHVASLFPGESDLDINSKAIFRSVTAVKPPPFRLTLGYAPLAVAREVWVLASGQGKHQALLDSLSPPSPRTPLGRVIQSRASTRIYSDIS